MRQAKSIRGPIIKIDFPDKSDFEKEQCSADTKNEFKNCSLECDFRPNHLKFELSSESGPVAIAGHSSERIKYATMIHKDSGPCISRRYIVNAGQDRENAKNSLPHRRAWW